MRRLGLDKGETKTIGPSYGFWKRPENPTKKHKKWSPVYVDKKGDTQEETREVIRNMIETWEGKEHEVEVYVITKQVTRIY